MQKRHHSRPLGRSGLLAMMLLVLPAASCEAPRSEESIEALAELGETQVIELSGFRFQMPVGWPAETVDSGSRRVEATMPGAGGADGTLIVYYFGEDGAGTVASNIARWCSQIDPPDATQVDARPKVEKLTINEMTVHTVDASGTYVAETAPGSGEFLNEPNQRMLAAIVVTDAGPYYLKARGPAATMRRWLDDWQAVLKTVQAAPVLETDAAAHP